MELLQRTATLPRGGGQSNCCNKAPHCLGPRGSATAVMHCHTGAVGSGIAAMRCHSACAQWVVGLM